MNPTLTHLNMHAFSPSEASDFHSGSSAAGNLSPQSHSSELANNIDLLKSFSISKRVTREGQLPKRRGPKPDSKPAQTRRQERNRQAQRTHRERKEQYIRDLEVELARLREAFTEDYKQSRQKLEHCQGVLQDQRLENTVLRDILAAKGIPFLHELEAKKLAMAGQSPGDSFVHPSPAPGVGRGDPASPPAYHSTRPPPGHFPCPNGGDGRPYLAPSATSPGPVYPGRSPAGAAMPDPAFKQDMSSVGQITGIFERDKQLGIDFILSLERVCRSHGEYLVRRSAEPPDHVGEINFSGHALMACCPPPSHIHAVPARRQGLEATYPHQLPDLPVEGLDVLFSLNQSLADEGHLVGRQVTPIIALQYLRAHPSYPSLTAEDVHAIMTLLDQKIRCHGFGAVIEDYQLREGVDAVLQAKHDRLVAMRESDGPM